MAQSITDEEIQLKKRARRRLVGAIALVLIVVIFLPMVLDNEPKPVSQDITIRIPSQDGTDFASKLAPVQEKPASAASSAFNATPEVRPSAPAPVSPTILPDSPAPAPAPLNSTEPVHDTSAKPLSTANSGQNPVAKDETKHKNAEAAQKPEPHKAQIAPKSQHGFVVQLGAFSNMANAKQRQARLSEIGVKFYSETIKSPSGDKLRVRAGPFATRQEAEKIQGKLKAAGIQDGIVAEKKE